MPIFKGKEVTLVGKRLVVGDKAPEAIVMTNELERKPLSTFYGDTTIISVVPSIDTGVCDFQTRQVNQDLNRYQDVRVLTVSCDLPFAQKRWCGSSGLDQVIVLSDYYDHDFGKAYGVLMEEWHLLTRAIFVLDKDQTIRYVEYIEDVHTHPDYEGVIEAVQALVRE